MADRILHRIGDIVLCASTNGWIVSRTAIVSEINKKTGEPNNNAGEEWIGDNRYYNTLAGTLKHMATRIAKRDAADLHDFMKILQTIIKLKTTIEDKK